MQAIHQSWRQSPIVNLSNNDLINNEFNNNAPSNIEISNRVLR